MEKSLEFETMPILPFVEGHPAKLIIGTFPPHRSRWKYEFFFPNLQNRLWNTLGRVAHAQSTYSVTCNAFDAAAVEERKGILRTLNAAMVNIIYSCHRKDGSALDNDLTVIDLHPIVSEILMPHPSITSIFLTSESGPNSCLSLLKRHLTAQGIRFHGIGGAKRSREERIEDPCCGHFFLEDRRIQVYSLYSPSPTAMRSGVTEEVLFRQYGCVLR